jgi:hypothetical protein
LYIWKSLAGFWNSVLTWKTPCQYYLLFLFCCDLSTVILSEIFLTVHSEHCIQKFNSQIWLLSPAKLTYL